MEELPEVIWLQIYGDESKDAGLPPDGAEITWCADKINETDVRYVLDKRHRPNRSHKGEKWVYPKVRAARMEDGL